MIILIVDTEELFNIFGLEMKDLGESMMKTLTIARLKFHVDVIVMGGSCKGHCFLADFFA